MGRSAKFFKRPTRKEKEQRALNPTIAPVDGGISKNKKHANVREEAKKALEQTLKEGHIADQDIDMGDTKANAETPLKQKEEEVEKRDYVDILTGKRTYRKPTGKFNKRHTIK
ncbi:hypothetical protein K450DRAFT_261723 [Umbelopsis ramanniana AG]|uniref:Uncharacterized protein n=1 Tax=Umbelopsis ramanniana AG TaxID=1314678 RepID=A0AAD5E197_UMBRA|nr:uncharacterized protein K450DRAFT_261723 [Umbelopsis ramanniana AG]KAI8575438.1 hypothetical protein K450DRAFT_261723 [Umbelopsis ramanniana AG]